MKDEIDLSRCKEFGEVKEIIDDWMDYYNNERYQWNLAKLSPNEYYEYITTGIYPLKQKYTIFTRKNIYPFFLNVLDKGYSLIQGIAQTIANMIKMNFKDEVIKQATGAKEIEIQRIRKQMMKV